MRIQSCQLTLWSLFISKQSGSIEEVSSYHSLPSAVLEDDVSSSNLSSAINAVGSRDTFVGQISVKDLDAEKNSHGLFQI